MVGVPPPKNCGNLNKVSQSHRKGSSRDVVPAKTAPRGENETKASKPHVPGWEMRRNKVLYYMEDAGGGEEAKSTCPWGDLREFHSRLAPKLWGWALPPGRTRSCRRRIRKGHPGSTPSMQVTQRCHHVAPKRPQQQMLPAPSPGATRGRTFCCHPAQGQASLPKSSARRRRAASFLCPQQIRQQIKRLPEVFGYSYIVPGVMKFQFPLEY